MKKVKKLILPLCLCLAGVFPANAGETETFATNERLPYYISVKGGIAPMALSREKGYYDKDVTGSSGVVDVAIGKFIAPSVRVELNYTHHDDVKSNQNFTLYDSMWTPHYYHAKETTRMDMLMGFFFFEMNRPDMGIRPYAGIGMGMVLFSHKERTNAVGSTVYESRKFHDVGVTAAVQAGVLTPINDHVGFDLSVRLGYSISPDYDDDDDHHHRRRNRNHTEWAMGYAAVMAGLRITF